MLNIFEWIELGPAHKYMYPDIFESATFSLWIKNCWIRWMHVNRSCICKEKDADSKISGYNDMAGALDCMLMYVFQCYMNTLHLFFFYLQWMAMNIFFLGADPTLKDSSGHQAIEYAGSTNIKDFLQDRMKTVIPFSCWYYWMLIVIWEYHTCVSGKSLQNVINVVRKSNFICMHVCAYNIILTVF